MADYILARRPLVDLSYMIAGGKDSVSEPSTYYSFFVNTPLKNALTLRLKPRLFPLRF